MRLKRRNMHMHMHPIGFSMADFKECSGRVDKMLTVTKQFDACSLDCKAAHEEASVLMSSKNSSDNRFATALHCFVVNRYP